MPSARVVIAEACPLIADAIQDALEDDRSLCVIGRAEDAAELLVLVRARTPDVAVLGLSVAESCATALLLSREAPAVRSVLVVDHEVLHGRDRELWTELRPLSRTATLAEVRRAVHDAVARKQPPFFLSGCARLLAAELADRGTAPQLGGDLILRDEMAS